MTLSTPVEVNLVAVNDFLTRQLFQHGWTADSEEDYSDLNDLTHTVAASIEGHLAAFTANRSADDSPTTDAASG